MALAWSIWQERNARVFEDKPSDVVEVWSKVEFMASLWAKASKMFQDLTISGLSVNWAAAIT